jgi:hypothetical protein
VISPGAKTGPSPTSLPAIVEFFAVIDDLVKSQAGSANDGARWAAVRTDAAARERPTWRRSSMAWRRTRRGRAGVDRPAVGFVRSTDLAEKLGVRARLSFELLVFELAVAGLPATGSLLLAIVFAATVCGNAGLLTVFRQWEQ